MINNISHLIPTPLVDYTTGIHRLKGQKKLYKKFPSLNPLPQTANLYGRTELVVKSLFSPEYVKKHEKLFKLLYNMFPPLVPKAANSKMTEGKNLYKESSLAPLQLIKTSIKTRLQYEKWLEKSGLH